MYRVFSGDSVEGIAEATKVMMCSVEVMMEAVKVVTEVVEVVIYNVVEWWLGRALACAWCGFLTF